MVNQLPIFVSACFDSDSIFFFFILQKVVFLHNLSFWTASKIAKNSIDQIKLLKQNNELRAHNWEHFAP